MQCAEHSSKFSVCECMFQDIFQNCLVCNSKGDGLYVILLNVVMLANKLR